MVKEGKEHDVLAILKKSLGINVVETIDVLVDKKMTVTIRGLTYHEELQATNLAYAHLNPVNMVVAEPLVKMMFVAFAVVSINGSPKPEMMGLKMDEISEESWETSQSYSEELNEQASVILARHFLKATDKTPINSIVTKYEDHFIEIDVERVLAHLVGKSKEKKEEEVTDGKKS